MYSPIEGEGTGNRRLVHPSENVSWNQEGCVQAASHRWVWEDCGKFRQGSGTWELYRLTSWGSVVRQDPPHWGETTESRIQIEQGKDSRGNKEKFWIRVENSNCRKYSLRGYSFKDFLVLSEEATLDLWGQKIYTREPPTKSTKKKKKSTPPTCERQERIATKSHTKLV